METARRPIGREGTRELPEPSAKTLMFGDHDEIQDIARQLARTKTELDRAVLTLRSWARDLGRRLPPSSLAENRDDELHALGETVGGLAHNLNNSLAAILAYAEMMLREEQTDKARRRLAVMRDVAVEASMTVRRLQEFVSREPQRTSGPVGLGVVIAEALEMTAPRWRDEAQRRGITITVTQDVETLPPVDGNATELRDALVGLILNAVAAMPQGGDLTIRAASENGGAMVVEVRDTGEGPADEARASGMDRSCAARSSRDVRHGLGHVVDIVERHGGELAVESLPGAGRTARIRLRASRFEIIPPSRGSGRQERRQGQPAGVLLVDDDPRLVAVLSDMLRIDGYRVTTATAGEQALDLFDPARHDVVITDLGMPGINGWELAGRVKERSPSTAVLMLTGWGESVLTEESSQLVDRVIAKPVSSESLLAQLAELARSRALSP
jgi:signal transduction histidine kinase/ActR/RegA family two-component response regulator